MCLNYCHKAKLVIELDGSQYYSEQGKAYDKERSAALSKYGLYVLRFPNSEVDRHFSAVCEAIHHCVQKRIEVSQCQTLDS